MGGRHSTHERRASSGGAERTASPTREPAAAAPAAAPAPPPQIAAALRERGVSTAFFAARWREFGNRYDHVITVEKARLFLKSVAAELDLHLEEETYDSIISSCKSHSTPSPLTVSLLADRT